MTLAQGLYETVRDAATVQDYVGDRVYPTVAPEVDPEEAPYRDVLVVGFDGAEFEQAPVMVSTYSLVAVSSVAHRAIELAEACVRLLHQRSAPLGTVATLDCVVALDAQEYDADRDLYAQPVSVRIRHIFS
jgi:hypothetical protein